jgi:xanthine dehydrogenase accessory factor
MVVDSAPCFRNVERFPHVDRLVRPGQKKRCRKSSNDETAIAMLTHDPKIDDPALKIALNSPHFTLVRSGARRPNRKDMRQRLLADGINEDQLARLHGPIGLILMGNSGRKIALAIMAEIVAARHPSWTLVYPPQIMLVDSGKVAI